MGSAGCVTRPPLTSQRRPPRDDVADESDEVDEGNEGWRADVEEWPRGGARGEDRSQEVGLLKTCRGACGRWCQRGEEQGVVHSPWTVQDQDQGQAGHQGRKEDDVRQGGRREGEASEDGGQSFRRRVLEAEHLSCAAHRGFLTESAEASLGFAWLSAPSSDAHMYTFNFMATTANNPGRYRASSR